MVVIYYFLESSLFTLMRQFSEGRGTTALLETWGRGLPGIGLGALFGNPKCGDVG